MTNTRDTADHINEVPTIEADIASNTADIALNTTAIAQGNNRGKNLIINGDFSVWQRGTSQTVGGYGSADRWDITQSGATHTSDQQVFTLGQTDVPNNPKYFFRHDVTTGNDFTGILQRVEDVTKTAGQPVTLSFWAKGTNPGSGALSLRIRQHFGTGGSPSSNVDVDAAPFVLTSSWQKFTYTFTPASVSGKTLGTDDNDYLYLLIGQGVDTSTDAWQLDIANVQLEFGTEATEFEYVSPADQLARCQRYFERFGGVIGATVYGAGYADTTTRFDAAVQYVLKRTTPTITYSATNGAIVFKAGSSVTSSATTVFNQTPSTALLSVTAAGLTAGAAGCLGSNSASDYLDIDAEL